MEQRYKETKKQKRNPIYKRLIPFTLRERQTNRDIGGQNKRKIVIQIY